jgi:hypothetical protein
MNDEIKDFIRTLLDQQRADFKAMVEGMDTHTALAEPSDRRFISKDDLLTELGEKKV